MGMVSIIYCSHQFKCIYKLTHILFEGYGQRYLTSRNAPTLPCSVPVLRHPPLSDRYNRVTAPTRLIGTDARAERRNADQIMLQTSGEVGRFYVDPEPEAVKLGRTLLKQPARHSDTNSYETTAQSEFSKPATARSGDMSGRMESCRTGRSTERSSFEDSSFRNSTGTGYNNAGLASTNTYVSTLQNLDKTFSNVNRRDLFAASLPGRPAQELVWCAANNNRGAQATKTWAQRLRKESQS